MNIYVTLYALTRGIIQYENADSSYSPTMATVNKYHHFHKPHWHLTFEEAKLKAEQMKVTEIKRLGEKIKKLEKTTFNHFKEAK